MNSSRLLSCAALASVIASCSPTPAPKPAQSTAPAPVQTVAAKPADKPTPAPTPPPRRPMLPQSERGIVGSISMEKLFELQGSADILIYDARPSVLYREGHLPGAISMPKSICKDVIMEREAELVKAKAFKKPIIVYCSGRLCADAKAVANHLSLAGYSSSIYSGGWDEWKQAGLPTE